MTTSAHATQSVPPAAQSTSAGLAHAGVGYSEQTDSRQAGEEAARLAMAEAGLDRCDLVLVFSTSKHDADALRDGVRSVVGPGPRIFGGSSVDIDCAGHASAICGSDGEESEEVQRAFAVRGVPMLGMYSGVEIAKVGGHVQPLDWTGVLCVFSE